MVKTLRLIFEKTATKSNLLDLIQAISSGASPSNKGMLLTMKTVLEVGIMEQSWKYTRRKKAYEGWE